MKPLILALLLVSASAEKPEPQTTQPVPNPRCLSPLTLAAALVANSLRYGPGVFIKPVRDKDGMLVFLVQYEAETTVMGYAFDGKGCLTTVMPLVP